MAQVVRFVSSLLAHELVCVAQPSVALPSTAGRGWHKHYEVERQPGNTAAVAPVAQMSLPYNMGQGMVTIEGNSSGQQQVDGIPIAIGRLARCPGRGRYQFAVAAFGVAHVLDEGLSASSSPEVYQ